MSYPKYFQNLPDIDYALTINKAGRTNNIKVKDFFHLMKVREDIFAEDTVYYEYNVVDGERPEQVAYKEYGDESYYWVVLQVNEITDYYAQWPLSYFELEEFMLKKYGGYENTEKIHHYETVETKDQTDNIVLPAGLTVAEDYVFDYPSYPGSNVILTSRPIAVSNREYEIGLNEQKSSITLIQNKYIFRLVDEFEDYATELKKNMASDTNLAEYYKQ